MKKILILILTFFITTAVNTAELNDVLNKAYQEASKSAEGYISNLISGQGDTEVSILERNNENTEFSIMVVRPLEIKDDNLLFYQGQISQYDVNKKSRQALNLGLGYRMLSDDGNYFSGVNTFFDVDSEENYRAGVGFELRSSSFELNGNYYNALSGAVTVGDETNRALNGHDITAVGQAPYLPWIDLSLSSYEWEAEQNSKNSEGEVFKGQFYLTKALSFEAGVDDNNITLDSTVMFNACDNYIKGIYWVYSYYKGSDIDCEWFYPYNYPPTLKDLTNHSIAYNEPIIEHNNNFVPSYVQLLIVLPKESSHLLKPKYKKFMNDIYMGLFHMYPVKYKIQTFLKTHLWECNPILPLINLNYIKRVIDI